MYVGPGWVLTHAPVFTFESRFLCLHLRLCSHCNLQAMEASQGTQPALSPEGSTTPIKHCLGCRELAGCRLPG